MNLMKKIIFGFLIGIAAITPGLSGGVIAAAFGLYKPMINSLLGLKDDFKTNVRYIMPYVIGGISGIVVFSRAMENLIRYSYYEVMYIFIGFVLGTIPSFLKEANKNGYKLIYPLISFLFVFISLYFGDIISKFTAQISNDFIRFLVIGSILSVGTVIPGVSSSFIMIKAGLYTEYISAVSDMRILEIAEISIGFIVMSAVIIKLIGWLFNKYHGYSHYSVLGFLLGSVILIFPGIRGIRESAVDFSLMYLSFILSFLVMSFETQN